MKHSHQRQRHHARPRPGPADQHDGPLLIWGIHAAAAALANPERVIVSVRATDNAIKRLADGLAARGLQPERVLPRDLDRRLGEDTVHQGVLMEVEPLPERDLSVLAGNIVDRGPLVVLDQVTDPHNVGAILRSAAVFGAAGIVMTRRHSPPLAGALAKSASGALEAVPVALVPNLARALEALKGVGVRVIGLDGGADALLEDELPGGSASGRPTALVLGAEGRGLRHLTAQTCDQLCRIGGDGPLGSLNVSNAAAVALHLGAMTRRRCRAP